MKVTLPDDQLYDVLIAMGLKEPWLNTDVAQMRDLLTAFLIFKQRNARYNDEWRRTGWRGMLFEARKKVSRVWQVHWNGREDKVDETPFDDVFDGINYLIFFMRMKREGGKPWGEWDE